MSKQQRRKGNARAASSAQAADLLTSFGQTASSATFTECDTSSTSRMLDDLEIDDDISQSEMQIALKKLIKKDALTREKGLKELGELLTEASLVDAKAGFKSFVAVFPKLSLDWRLTIRHASLRVLETFICKLQKECEPFLKKARNSIVVWVFWVLPYALFLMHDGNTAVADASKEMLKNCFVSEKHAVVVDMCRDALYDIAIQMVNVSHPLSNSKDEEETSEQRCTRLKLQGLRCLRWACAAPLSEDQQQQMVQLFSRRSMDFFRVSAPQVISS
ncbi:unnamed protein product [Gongylonema pulchrum]|uniref:E3 ubiquitin-protein ligase listerin n=1 Tax=Gongylonema pulchrum TaxID=637853 RepID=A0A183DWR7_9BILA|nr:unnamed protein product [Gongylonema pulchrum]